MNIFLFKLVSEKDKKQGVFLIRKRPRKWKCNGSANGSAKVSRSA